jgi:hypothetical protein
MTNTKDKRLLFAAILPAIATVVIAAYLLTNTTQEAQAIQTPVPEIGNIVREVETPQSHIAKGGSSAVEVDISPNQVSLSRGSTVTVDVHIKHIQGTAPFPFVNVKAVPPSGNIFYPPSLASSTTPEQRLQAAETGKLIPGSIDLGTLVSFSAASPIKIGAGGDQVVKMNISIPQDFPAEMIGHGVFLEVPIEVTDNNGKSDTVVWQNGGITVVVVG